MEFTMMLRTIAALGLSGLMVVTAMAADEIKPLGPVKKISGDFKFTEGPAADAQGNVYFTDIPNERIHKIDLEGKITVFREKSNKANGLMVNKKGEIVGCEMEGQVVAYSADGKSRRVIVGQYNGVRFNSTNDLVIDKTGGIYFTDPEYNAPKPWPQTIRTIYYVDATGKVSRLIDKDLPNPNGIILSPDEKTLYVIPSSSSKMLVYPVLAPGKIGEGKVFCELAQRKGQNNGGGDGLAIDVKGNLYITTGLGVQIFSPEGKALGIIEVPEGPANCDFGGKDLKTLFITAKTSVYSVEMPIAGHRFAAE
jgi:gluconolactonase